MIRFNSMWIKSLVIAGFVSGLAACGGGELKEDTSPTDSGKLRASHVEMFIEVQSWAHAQNAKNAQEILMLELEAAARVGYEAEDYQWVKQRILEARPSPAGVSPDLEALSRSFRQHGAELSEDFAEAAEAGPETSNGAVIAANRELLETYASELRQLEAQSRTLEM